MALVQFNDVCWFDPFEITYVKDNISNAIISFKNGSEVYATYVNGATLETVINKIEEMKDIAEPLRRVISG